MATLSKKIKSIFILSLILVLFAGSFSVSVGYSFYDLLTKNNIYTSIDVGQGFWDDQYVFANLDPADYNTTGVWTSDAQGFKSNNGSIYFPNRKDQYVITSSATLSGDTVTHGAYEIYFESVLDENDKVDGYALVWDNISNSVKIVQKVDGVTTSTLLEMDNASHSFLPATAADAAWRQNNEIIIQVSDSLTPGYKYLNVWVNNNQLVTDYLIDEVADVTENITGYCSSPLETTFVQLDVTDYVSNIFTITFESNGGSAVNSIREVAGTAISAPADPIIFEGTFDNWYTDAALTTPYTFTVMPSNNLTLYAGWTMNQYTISFNSNGGSAISAITQDYNTAVTQPTDPTRTGYTFDDWYSDAGLTTPYVFGTMPNSNNTLYAGWNINQYTISFNSNGGSAVADIVQDYNTTVTQPTNPTRDGYLFVEWQLSGVPYVFGTMPANNITLDATWSEIVLGEYIITFDSNGGSPVDSILETEGNAISAPTAPTRTGYSFVDWYSDAALTTPYVFTTMPSNNITLYADWNINQYTMSFDTGGGSTVADIVQDYNTAVAQPADPTRSGYLFLGWTYNSSPYTFTTMPASNITIVADWELIQNYTITFNSNGGSVVNPIVETNGTAISAPTDPTYAGYNFLGWYTEPALTNLYVFDVMPNYDFTLYAKWQIEMYTITFISNGGSNTTPITQAYGTAVTAPNDPVRTGNFFFAGWYEDASLLTPYTFTTMPGEDIYVYADWGSSDLIFQKINTTAYSVVGITSNANYVQIPQRYQGLPVEAIGFEAFLGNTYIEYMNIPHTVTSIKTRALEGCLALKEIYIPIEIVDIGKDAFKDCDIVEISAKATSKPAGWHGEWNPDSRPVHWGMEFVPDMVFVSNGGSAVTTITQYAGTVVTEPANPIRTGYTFNGWFTDDLFTNQFIFNVMPSIDTTLYAKWTINQYTITFDSVGGQAVASITQDYNTTVIEPNYPLKDNNLFVEWQLSGVPYVFDTMPASNITLTAVWQQLALNEYAIIFNSNGGTEVPALVEIAGNSISAPTDPTRTGYTFNGWYTDEALTNPYTFNTMPSSNIALYAKWTINQYTITFITNGGSAVTSITQDYNTSVSMPANPTRSGYIFSGWYADIELRGEYEFTTMPASNINVYADWGTSSLTYQLISGVGYMVLTGDSNLTTIQIPQKYLGLPVVEIQNQAFEGFSKLQSINIPHSVTTIGYRAFKGATKLTEIYIPLSVTDIGYNAFQGCRDLVTIYAEAASQPAGWDVNWNPDSKTVIWSS